MSKYVPEAPLKSLAYDLMRGGHEAYARRLGLLIEDALPAVPVAELQRLAKHFAHEAADCHNASDTYNKSGHKPQAIDMRASGEAYSRAAETIRDWFYPDPPPATLRSGEEP